MTGLRLTHFLTRSAARRPQAIAVEDGDIRQSWEAFHDTVARLAAVLHQAGASEGDRIAFLLDPGHRALEMFFAPLWLGAIIAPLNLRWTQAELEEALDLLDPTILVVSPDYEAKAQACRARRPSLTILSDGDELARSIAEARPLPERGTSGDAPAAIFFTAGTTGKPRGAVLSHANLAINTTTAASIFGTGEMSAQLHAQPLFHLAGAARVYVAVMAGARQVILPRFDPGIALGLIETARITHIGMVPTTLGLILDHPDVEHRDISSLVTLGYGAAPMPEALIRRAMARAPGIGFVNSYGMTELSPVALTLSQADHVEAMAAGSDRLRSLGRPVYHVDVAIMDDDGKVLPHSSEGEICVRGPTVMLGYWNDRPATEAVMREGWLRTGDVGRMDGDGFFYLVDRLKDMIITGGVNVSSIEVENALYAHPSVKECAVIGRADPHWGEAVHAVVVLTEPCDAATLETHCRTRLAGYKLPKSWDFRQEPLPRTGAGKVSKKDLRQ